ncbi:MAG: hypothetical protein WCI57_01565 [Candidatus Berkelbacteria bacterium]
MADKIEDNRQRVVKRVQFAEQPLELQEQMRAQVAPKKQPVAQEASLTADNAKLPEKEPPMTLERAKKLMSGMNRAAKLDFIREIFLKKDPPVRQNVIVAIVQSAMSGMNKSGQIDFINLLSGLQNVERTKLNEKKEKEVLRRVSAQVTLDDLPEKTDESPPEEVSEKAETPPPTTILADEQSPTVTKAPVKPKTPVHRANGTKPKHKGRKHSAVATQNHKASKTKLIDVPEETQTAETIEPEIIQTEIIQPEIKAAEQQILPGTVISSAPDLQKYPDVPYKSAAVNKAETKKAETKIPKAAVLVDIRRRSHKPEAPVIEEETAKVEVAESAETENVATPTIVETDEAPTVENVKIITNGSSTTIQVGSEAFSLTRTKLLKMLNGSIKLEVAAEKVIVKDTIPMPKKANEFEMIFGFDIKTEVEKVNEKPGTGKVMFVGDMDNFTSYLRYQDRISIADIAKYYIKGREMLVKPQYFVSCMHVPSPHVHSFRDRYTHQVMATEFFNVEWKRIKKSHEDDSMYDPDLPMDLKARPRGYGDADVARFLLQQDNLEKCETILLWTHDEHFTSTVLYLRSIGKIVELHHTGRWWTSTNLRNACDTETDITERFPADYPDKIFDELERRKLR